MRIIESKSKKGLCCAHGCLKKKISRQRFCNKHKHEAYKQKNPLVYTFAVLRRNARRRGKVFTLSLLDFSIFCSGTGYLNLKGRSAESASIDRIDARRGYEAGNLQLLSLSDNTKKRWEEEPF